MPLFFKELPFSQQSLLRGSHFFLNSYFFRAKLLPSRHFLRIGSSLGQVLFGTPTFLVEKPYKDIFRRRTFPNQVVLCNIFRRVTFWKKLFFRKSNSPHCLLLLDNYFIRVATFPEELLFRNILFQRRYYFTATITLPINLLVIKLRR